MFIIGINLDTSSIKDFGDYKLYRVKSVKLVDIKTFTVCDVGLDDYEKLEYREFELDRHTLILEKNGIFYEIKRNQCNDSYVTISSLNGIYYIEIDGKIVKNRALSIASVVGWTGVQRLVDFKYDSKNCSIKVATSSGSHKVSCTVLKLKNNSFNYLDAVERLGNYYYTNRISIDEYFRDTVERLEHYYYINKISIDDYFGGVAQLTVGNISIVDITQIKDTIILPSNSEEIIVYGVEVQERNIENLVLNKGIKKLLWKVGSVSLSNVVLCNGYSLDALKSFVYSYVKSNRLCSSLFRGCSYGVRDIHNYREFKKVLESKETLNELLDLRIGDFLLGNIIKFSVV